MARFDRVIPPGGSGKIVLSLDAKKVRGAFAKSALVHSNDAAHPSFRILIKGLVRQYVDLQPVRLFLRGSTDDQPKATVIITSNLDQPLTIKGVTSPGLEGKIDWDLKTLQEGKQYRLDVVNKAGVGRYFGKVVLLTDCAKRPTVDIPIYVDITGEVGHYPNRLEMGRLVPGGSNPGQQVVTLWKNRGGGFTLKKLTYDRDRYDVSVKQQGTRYQLMVRCKLENMKPGEFRDELKIETSSADVPEVVVPIHGWVQ